MQSTIIQSAQQKTIDNIFAEIPNLLISEKATGIDGAYQVLFTDLDYPWFTIIQDDQCATYQGRHHSPIVTMTLSSENFVAITQGKLSETLALMTKKMKLEGNILQAIKYSRAFRKMQ